MAAHTAQMSQVREPLVVHEMTINEYQIKFVSFAQPPQSAIQSTALKLAAKFADGDTPPPAMQFNSEPGAEEEWMMVAAFSKMSPSGN